MFKGIIPPVVIFFDQDGEIDYSLNKKHIDHLINSGIDGVLLLGSSSEFSSLKFSEKTKYLKSLIPYINGRVPVMVGVGNTVLKESIELAQYAESMGAQGVMAVNPYYYKLSNNQMVEYFTEISNAVSINTYLYNIPQLTGQEIPIDVIATLVKNQPTIRGIKETVAEFGRIRKVLKEIKEKHPQFDVFTAFDEHLVDGYLIGATGSINGTSNFLPEVTVNLLEALEAKEFDKVQKYQMQISSLMSIYEINSSFFSTFKEGAYYRWFNDRPSGVRKPYSKYDKDTRTKVGELIDTIIKQGVYH